MQQDDDADDAAPGWQAIDAALQPLYGQQPPLHYGTLISWRLGGNDPLQGISAYARTEPVPHWHFITYGLSELYDKESDDPETSGYGFELTLRLRRESDDTDPPVWALNFLQNLARYVFTSGQVFAAGHFMNLNGPIALERDTRIESIGFVADPELPGVQTPNGHLDFLQVVGMTLDEERAAKRWSTHDVLQSFLPLMPLWITDLERDSLMQNPDIAAAIEAGSRVSGSRTGFLFIDVLQWTRRKRLLRADQCMVTLGALQAAELVALLPLRLPFGKPFRLVGNGPEVVFEPSETFRLDERGDTMHIGLTGAHVDAIARTLQPQAGEYAIPGCPQLHFHVQKNLIHDSDGTVVRETG